MNRQQRIRRILSMMLLFTLTFTNLGLENFAVQAATKYITIYLVDDTKNQWVGDNNAVMELVDKTGKSKYYTMTKQNNTTWSVDVPTGTNMITFQRLSPDRKQVWNCWYTGGKAKDKNYNTYHILDSDYGYWGNQEKTQEGFQEGDVVYLDFYEFSDWENSNASFYVCFTKEDSEKDCNSGCMEQDDKKKNKKEDKNDCKNNGNNSNKNDSNKNDCKDNGNNSNNNDSKNNKNNSNKNDSKNKSGGSNLNKNNSNKQNNGNNKNNSDKNNSNKHNTSHHDKGCNSGKTNKCQNQCTPILLTEEIEDMVFTYTVTKEEEGATELKFWRGDDKTLWNCSVSLSYEDYKAGNNCVKVQGWCNKGYVCPYVPRKHVPDVDMELKVDGNQKVNRKITIDLMLEGENDLLSLEDTLITIEKEQNGVSDEITDTAFLTYDDSKTTWNHRELLFTQPGTYHITAVVTDGTEEITTDTDITIVNDEAPAADFTLNGDGNNVYLRDETGTAKVTVTDASISELGDSITKRVYILYHDADADGMFTEEEIINTKEGNETTVSYDLTNVGNYMVILSVQETFEDTIPALLDENAYLSDDTKDMEQSKAVFEITNLAPVSSMGMEKSRTADIIFTVGNADEETLKQYAAATQKVQEELQEKGIDATINTVTTSALTAEDTFAWTEYDHYNFADPHLPTMEKHILYEGSDIRMMGYSETAMKDFLYIEDNDDSLKIFEFDLQRDGTDWHSMEGGGFLFNTRIEGKYITGYCALVTQSGLQLIQIRLTSTDNFRNGSYWSIKDMGTLLRTFPMNDLYGEHHFKIMVDKNTITIYDGDTILADSYVVPDDGIEAYGYGPITSHYAHNCAQQSYFTFKNITMQTYTGEDFSDLVNSHEWTPGNNHYVINLSETFVPELSDNDCMADVAASMIKNDTMFFGIGTDNSINQYNALLNSMEGKGENILLTGTSDGETTGSLYEVTVDEAVDQIVARIVNDIQSKDYSIGYALSTDEEVVYTGTYQDPENDPVGTEEWNYLYDATVFGEIQAEIKTLVQETPITMFTESGAYEITHRVSDNPAGDNESLNSYTLWSDTDEYKKLILVQHRPKASIKVDAMQDKNNPAQCLVNVVYESEDPDHPSDSRKGIREENFYYKKLEDQEWTEGRFPTSVEMGTTYLVKYIVTDIEGTVSRPAVAAVKTLEAGTYIEPSDTNPPEVNLTVSSTLLQTGESFYIEASAMDDYGVKDFTIKVNGEDFRTTYGRYEYIPETAGEYLITVTAVDIGGNETTETTTVTVRNNSDITPPEITITSQTSGAIAGNIVITGSITDNKELKSYTVTRSKVITTNNEETNSSTESSETLEESVIIASGTKEIINDIIAEVETSNLENGVYRIEILAEDAAGLTTGESITFTVNRKTIDRIPPQAVIDNIMLDEENNIITVIGSITDETAVGGYELILFKTDTPDETTIIATGTTSLSGEIIGTIPTDDLENANYTLQLIAFDAQGNHGGMEVVFEYEYSEEIIEDETGEESGEETEEESKKAEIKRDEDTTIPVITGELAGAITKEGLTLTLTGTIADENLKEYTIVTGKTDGDNNLIDPVTVITGTNTIENATLAQYTYDKFSEGTYMVKVTATDQAGNKRVTDFAVKITANNTINDGYTGENGKGENGEAGTGESEEGNDSLNQFNLVLSRTSAYAGDTVKAYITYPQEAKDLTLSAEGAEVELYGRTADIRCDQTGEIEVILTATINGEETKITQTIRFYDSSDKIHPKASFLTPEADSELKNKTQITGTAWDETSLAYYTLEYSMEGTGTYIEIARGEEMVENGILGELDTTMLENGRYLLRLTVVDNGGNRLRVERSINVSGNLKIGNFSLSFTDISANVSGIPLTVIRSYDSRNKTSGDFGTGWRLGLQSVRLSEANDLSYGYEMIQEGQRFSTGYYVVQTLCHDITVTYGDGTSDRFALKVSPERQAVVPIYEVKVNFVCLTNPKVTLELNGNNQALLSGEELIFEDEAMMDSRSYILTRADGTKWYLSSEHGLLKMQDTNGNTVTLTQNGFTHSDGNGIRFTRDEKGRIIKAEETSKDQTLISSLTYAYDENDNLIAVTDKAGRTVNFTYDEDHNLIDIIDPSGIAVARNEYDENGRLIATIDAEGNRIEYEHDIEGRTEVVRDKMGNATVYTYDENGNILKIVDALGNVTTNTYDADNNLLTSTDALGNTTTYVYDENNGLTTLTMADGVTQTIKYNTLNLVNTISMEQNLLITMDYDEKGNLTSMTDSLGNETNLSYASNGNLTGITDQIGVVQTLTYDDEGNLATLKDGNGNGSSFTYDETGRCIGVTVTRTEADGTKKEYTSTYQYDSAGNITAAISTKGAVTAYEYDFRNALNIAPQSFPHPENERNTLTMTAQT